MWHCSASCSLLASSYSEHAPIRFRAWGSAPPSILKLGTSGVAKFLICAFIFLKTPTPKWPVIHPKFGLILGAINTSFVSSLLFCAQRNRGASCLGTEKDQGGRNKEFEHADFVTVEVEECSQLLECIRAFKECFEEGLL